MCYISKCPFNYNKQQQFQLIIYLQLFSLEASLGTSRFRAGAHSPSPSRIIQYFNILHTMLYEWILVKQNQGPGMPMPNDASGVQFAALSCNYIYTTSISNCINYLQLAYKHMSIVSISIQSISLHPNKHCDVGEDLVTNFMVSDIVYNILLYIFIIISCANTCTQFYKLLLSVVKKCIMPLMVRYSGLEPSKKYLVSVHPNPKINPADKAFYFYS